MMMVPERPIDSEIQPQPPSPQTTGTVTARNAMIPVFQLEKNSARHATVNSSDEITVLITAGIFDDERWATGEFSPVSVTSNFGTDGSHDSTSCSIARTSLADVELSRIEIWVSCWSRLTRSLAESPARNPNSYTKKYCDKANSFNSSSGVVSPNAVDTFSITSLSDVALATSGRLRSFRVSSSS